MLLLANGEQSWIEYIKYSGFGWRDRPVSILSFIGNFTLTGSSVWSLKAVNLTIHLCCGILIYSLCLLLLSQPVTNVSSQARKWIALWVVSAWLLAPIQVSTTLYVIQRMAQLSTLFILAGLLCYVVGRQQLNENPKQGYLLIILTFIVFWPLAIFSKENGIILPLLVFITELFFFHKKKYDSGSVRIIFNSLLILLAVPLFIVLVMTIYDPGWLLSSYYYRDFTLYERVITQPRILVDYLANMLMIPGGSGMGLFHDDYQKSSSLFFPVTTLLSIGFWFAIITYGFYKMGTKSGFVLYGLVFYIAAHLIESSIIPLELYFEHRNYLPSFGVFFAIALGIYYLIATSKIKTFIMVAMIAIISCYGLFTIYRVDIWRSWESILLASQEQHPDSLRVQRGLTVVHTHRGELKEALEHLGQVERLDPGYGETGITMKYLMAYCYSGQFPPEKIYQRLDKKANIPGDFYTGTVFLWLVESVEKGDCISIDLDKLLKILHHRILYEDEDVGKNHNSWVQLILLARLYAHQSDWPQARQLVDLALKLNPEAKSYVEYLKRNYNQM